MAFQRTTAFTFLIATTFCAVYIVFTQQRELVTHQIEVTRGHDRDEQKLHEETMPIDSQDTLLGFNSPETMHGHADEDQYGYKKIVPPGPYMWVPMGDRGQYQGTHLVLTTFCFGQGRFPDLVASRLLLFKTICLPSMLAQTVQHFLWLIYIDDTLEADVVAELKALIGDRSNFKIVTRDGGKSTSTVTSPQSMSLEKQMRRAKMEYFPPSKINAMVLTTRLDADDGLHFTAIDEIHAVAGKWFKKSKGDNKPAFFCWVQGVAWQPTSITPEGGFVIDTPAAPDAACLSPGLTMLSKKIDARSVLVEGIPHNAPQNRNHTPTNIRRRLGDHVTPFPVGISFEKPPIWPSNQNYRFPIRARTVASNGMYKVEAASQFSGSTLLSQRLGGVGIETTYAITSKMLATANQHFLANEKQISTEHFQARCLEPFVSCKYVAKNKLKSIMGLN